MTKKRKSYFFYFIFFITISQGVIFNLFSDSTNYNLDPYKYFYSVVDSRYQVKNDLKNYLLNFPFDKYSIVNVQNSEKYYIDLDSGKNDCIKNVLLYNHFWESYLRGKMKEFIIPGTDILDIGSHIGTHTIHLARSLTNGIVHAFEPQPKIFRELFYNLLLNNIQNVKLYNCAVGSENKVVELSPLIMGNEGATRCTGHGNSGNFIDVVPIDSLNLNNISLIKIDVEEMEDFVLEGARQTIERNKPVIFIEFTGYDITKCDQNRKKILLQKFDRLQQMGYNIQQICDHDYFAYPITK
jgi:FkbM family methyltransferase